VAFEWLLLAPVGACELIELRGVDDVATLEGVPMLAVDLRLAFDPQARALRVRDDGDGDHEDAAHE
jgi:hypothetical protein